MVGRLGRGAFDGVTFTVGTEASNVINVACQFTLGGVAVAERVACYMWLSDTTDPGGAQTAHSTAPAIGTDGALHPVVTDLAWIAITESDGDLDIDFTDSGAQTVYLNALLPDGSIVQSGAITHAA